MTAIVNPVSGGGAARLQWRAVAAALGSRGVATEAVESASSTDATARAAAAARAGHLVVAVGGDGHVRDVAQGVVTVPDATLAIVAAGRGNDLVRHLGLPTDPLAIADMLAGGDRRRIDIATVGDRIALGNVYVGLDSESTELINRMRWMGRAAYRVAPVLAAVGWRPARFDITVDGVVTDVAAHMVVIANSGDYGHGLRIVPSADVSSGRLDVLVVRADHSQYRLANLMKQAKSGAHINRPEIVTMQGTDVSVAADRRIPVHADGDYLSELPMRVTIRPSALEVLVPAAT